jgi:hypothetical protein
VLQWVFSDFLVAPGLYEESDMARKDLMPLMTAKEAAEFLRVSMFTLSKIEREGQLVPFRTPGGHRRYSMDMLRSYLEGTRDHPLNQRYDTPQ